MAEVCGFIWNVEHYGPSTSTYGSESIYLDTEHSIVLFSNCPTIYICLKICPTIASDYPHENIIGKYGNVGINYSSNASGIPTSLDDYNSIFEGTPPIVILLGCKPQRIPHFGTHQRFELWGRIYGQGILDFFSHLYYNLLKSTTNYCPPLLFITTSLIGSRFHAQGWEIHI